jgi:hypothetical protein
MPTSWVDEALAEAIERLEKVAHGLEPELVAPGVAEGHVRRAARAANLVTSIELTLAPRLPGRDRAPRLARLTGSGLGAAHGMLTTAQRLSACPRTRDAMAMGDLSYAQGAEIARTEAQVPGCEAELVGVARSQPLGVLKDTARALRQAALDPETLEARRRTARHHRHWVDELGMIRYSGAMLPEFGVPFAARLDAETDRVFRAATGEREERSQYAADAFARLVEGKGKGPARRPELVLVGDLDAYAEGRGLEPRIPGVGPVSADTLRRQARDAIVSVVLYSGTDFVKIRRWSRSLPVEIATVLEIGEPPGFAGRRCRRCGSRFRVQGDHIDPHTHGGEMCIDNLQDLCPACHREKTEDDRRRGLLGKAPPRRRK